MADGDIFVGLAKGIQGGLQGYMDAQRLNADDEDRAMRKKMAMAQLKAAETEEARKRDDQEIGLLKEGLKIKRDESGGFLRDPEGGLISERIPGFQKQVDPAVQAQRDLNIQLAQQRLAEGRAKTEEAAQKKQFEKTFEGRVGKLNAAEKDRFDKVAMGLKSVQGMKDALEAGENTFSLMGDNQFTLARSQWEEAIGRLQSGGAINAEEATRFRKLIPGTTDSAAMQKKKLTEAASLMGQRLKTLGFSDADADSLGVRPEVIAGKLYARKQKSGTGLSAQDQEAMNWARKNVNDPRAQEILKRLNASSTAGR